MNETRANETRSPSLSGDESTSDGDGAAHINDNIGEKHSDSYTVATASMPSESQVNFFGSKQPPQTYDSQYLTHEPMDRDTTSSDMSEVPVKTGTLQFALDSVRAEDFPLFVKKHENTLTFPEKLMLLLMHVERMCINSGKRQQDESIGWSENGKGVVIRDKQHLTSRWLPLFFSYSKYSSFTRKLYRWGFRKKNSSSASHPKQEAIMLFSNAHFQKDNLDLLQNMRSVTAAKLRSKFSAQTNGSAPATNPESQNFSSAPSSLSAPHWSQGFTDYLSFPRPLQSNSLLPPMITSSLGVGTNGSLLNPSQATASDLYGLALQRNSAWSAQYLLALSSMAGMTNPAQCLQLPPVNDQASRPPAGNRWQRDSAPSQQGDAPPTNDSSFQNKRLPP